MPSDQAENDAGKPVDSFPRYTHTVLLALF